MQIRRKIPSFIFGVSIGLIIGIGFFIFKLDDYFNKMKSAAKETIKIIEKPVPQEPEKETKNDKERYKISTKVSPYTNYKEVDSLIRTENGEINLAKEEFISADPVLWNRWMSGEEGVRAGNTGETMAAAANRVSAFFKDLFEEKKQGTFLVAAHNAVNRFFLAQQLGMPLHHYRRLWFDNGAITEFVIEDNGSFVLKKLNA